MCNPVTSKSSVLYHFLQDLGVLHFDQMFCFMMFIWMADTFLSSSSHSGQHPTNASLQCSGCIQRNLKGASSLLSRGLCIFCSWFEWAWIFPRRLYSKGAASSKLRSHQLTQYGEKSAFVTLRELGSSLSVSVWLGWSSCCSCTPPPLPV